MNRIVYMVVRHLFQTPIWFFHIDKMGKQRERYSLQERYDYIRKMVKETNVESRMDVQEYRAENLPKEDGFALLPNHQRLFDMLAITDICPKPMGVVIEEEAENWVLVKQVLVTLSRISMDRSDTKTSPKIIDQISERVKLGGDSVIFPEGAKSRDEDNILDSKAGTFRSAVSTHYPIMPVVLTSSFKPFGISSIRKERAQARYLDSIYPEQYMGLKTKEIADIIHNRAQEKINNNLGRFLIEYLLTFQLFSSITVDTSKNRDVL